ncbi:protein EARLY FLOWERING 4 [Rosa rugosa]|uniref:protein EARLY FLOWERING 4 n=1 Tax=Rosa rugosa TaxID=74645 RepID=UPI002B40BC35|nr:protein EARLY FLOWERING 4 [Rosa rugosa]
MILLPPNPKQTKRPTYHLPNRSKNFHAAHMTTRESSSGLDSSSMDDQPTKRTVSLDPEPEPEPEPGGEVWVENFNRSFRQVQAVLDRNRALIQQVNDNHQSRIPANMVKNVALIQEINANIRKVVSLYSDLSSDFSTVFPNKERCEPS